MSRCGQSRRVLSLVNTRIPSSKLLLQTQNETLDRVFGVVAVKRVVEPQKVQPETMEPEGEPWRVGRVDPGLRLQGSRIQAILLLRTILLSSPRNIEACHRLHQYSYILALTIRVDRCTPSAVSLSCSCLPSAMILEYRHSVLLLCVSKSASIVLVSSANARAVQSKALR